MDNTKYKNISRTLSLIVHILIVILLIMPILHKINKEDPQGILIAFGDPDSGSPTEAPQVGNTSSAAITSPPASSNHENIASTDRTETAPLKATDKKETQTKTTNSNNEDAASRKLEAERSAKAAQEKANAEKEAQDRANQKKKFTDLFGKGQGNNNSTGNQGTDKGNPDGQALEGITKGSGRVGGGLTGRGIEFEPSFSDNSQKTGKVNLSICVDANGKVIKAEFTQRGSTTSDTYLIDLAKRSAIKYKFSKSENDMQCGTVLIDFKLK